MNLFQTYTGSAFLNQALITLQELTGKQSIAELSTSDIRQAFDRPYKNVPLSLTNINRRLKSYTMVFTKNGPLHNDKEKGKEVYETLLRTILSKPENEGDKICELSGLRFTTTFDSYYQYALNAVQYSKEKIGKKDLTINRCWFPLIGGLGSDAQALPQASFAVNIHPVCLAVLQFLPLSALLYKGGVLLVDSPDFLFTRSLIKHFVQRVKEEVTSKGSTATIENIKDLNKGDYLILALSKLADQEAKYSGTTGFNFWSFSNSGTGASCYIDRIPNELVRKLRLLYEDAYCANQLKFFLHDSKYNEAFLLALEDNRDFYGLYPRKNYEGSPITFFERYQQIINSAGRMELAKYMAHLVHRYDLSKDERKLLTKTDAHTGENSKRYVAILNKVLREAAGNQQWHPLQHISILDDSESLPIRSSFYRILPMVHFYFQKLEAEDEVEVPDVPEAPLTDFYRSINLFLSLLAVEKDERTKQQLMGRDYQNVTLNELLWRTGSKFYNLEDIYPILYNKENHPNKRGLREILHLFLLYTQGELSSFSCRVIALELELRKEEYDYLSRLRKFSAYYFDYWRTNRNNNSTDLDTFRQHVLRPMLGNRFHIGRWLEQVIERMKKASVENSEQWYTLQDQKVFSENLLYDFTGEYNLSFARFAIAYNLHQLFYLTHKTKQPQHG